MISYRFLNHKTSMENEMLKDFSGSSNFVEVFHLSFLTFHYVRGVRADKTNRPPLSTQKVKKLICQRDKNSGNANEH